MVYNKYTMKTFHNPVLLSEVLASLEPKPGESYLDLTAGYAGHADQILAITRNYKESVLVDRDENSIDFLKAKYQNGEAPEIIHDDFYSAAFSIKSSGKTFDMILADFGVSSPQLDNKERGFSFQGDGPLDMRMDPSKGKTAADFINHSSLAELIDIFTKYGELSPGLSRKVALKVIQSRPINTTMALAETVKTVLPRHGRIHPEARVFQAVRIAVNDELNIIEKTLPLLPDLLNPGGRVAIITFHSLEDRLVKSYFKEASEYGEESKLEIITKSPITPESLELGINPRARSAKLRVAKRV
ncbi:16S rRNA (cytosine(1402)-N(4))-methyltransferase RsmH [Candidatus Saccharibacteria bacterium]|nr:16S rRNA (cytosine(1402)-N(4))-methyltransferase RsmH [Candidatus Saccharibacteria bacterium]